MISVTGSRTPGEDQWDIPIDIKDDDKTEDLQFNLAGFVWEEEKAEDKSGTKLDGIKNDNKDIFKEGVEVTLYYADQGKAGQKVNKDANRKNLQNPYVTGYDGYYVFKDLDSKYKYYIEYTYDGQQYQATTYSGFKLPTETYTVGSDKFKNDNVKFDSSNPEINSNGIEYENTRTEFNKSFTTIESASQSYIVRRTLYITANGTNRNTAYITGKYSTETPYGIKEIYDYVKEEAIKENSYKKAYEKALSKYGNNDTTKSKLQFIEDCRITAYSVASVNDTKEKTYPIFDKFAEVFEGKKGYTQDDTVEGMSVKWKKGTGKRHYALYPKHLNIDFGITRREEFDMALIKDVQKATIEINGKSQTYRYDQRIPGEDGENKNTGIWEIDIRLSDAGYFKDDYTRYIFPEDYEYKLSMYNRSGLTAQALADKSELEVYITYKLLVYNQSQKIKGEITEIVDYYDDDLEYVDERSYIHYEGEGNQKHPVGWSNQSIYNKSGQVTTVSGYQNGYITGLKDHLFNEGEVAYVVLTFKVRKDDVQDTNTDIIEKWIKLDEDIRTGTPGIGKENIAEINGFKTYYDNVYVPNVGKQNGTAGLLDKDSVPGNLRVQDVNTQNGTIELKNIEDDTDKAPNILLRLYRDGNGLLYRQIDGVVWEDVRNSYDGTNKTAVGNGYRDEANAEINGATVQLVEIMNNGEEFLWQEFSSGQNNVDPNDKFLPIINLDVSSGIKYVRNSTGLIATPGNTDGATDKGKYIFRSYAPGNYVVRFKYGDTIKTVLPQSNEVTSLLGETGQNAKSYNGQDYKSTTYQKDITQPSAKTITKLPNWIAGERVATEGEEIITINGYNSPYSNNSKVTEQFANIGQSYLYGITESDARGDVSDAKDIVSRRNSVINYSNSKVTNRIAEVLASHKQIPSYNGGSYSKDDVQKMVQELENETYMVADTGLIVAEIEYDRTSTNYNDAAQGNYKIKNVDLGLEERPKAQLLVDKKVTNVRLTLADGSTLFDASDKATNVLWQQHDEHQVNMNTSRYRLEQFTDGQLYKLRAKTAADAIDSAGLIQLSMDSELMHGATIKVSYEITVRNVGEVDYYKDNSFYYKGVVSTDNVVTTTPEKLVDYVANNLQFYAVDNNAWETIKVDTLIPGSAENKDADLVNSMLKEKATKFNTIITTKDSSESSISGTALTPEISGKGTTSVTDKLVLTQTITSENNTDDLTYRNLVELVKTSNTVGRRMEVSVVGNQDPSIVTSGNNVSEIDSDIAQVVKILPPFGNAGQPYVIVAIVLASSLILIAGIVFIRKKILK